MSTDDGSNLTPANSSNAAKEVTTSKKQDCPRPPDVPQCPNASKLPTLIAVNPPNVLDVQDSHKSHTNITSPPQHRDTTDKSNNFHIETDSQTTTLSKLSTAKQESTTHNDCLIAIAERDRCLMPPPPLPVKKHEMLGSMDSNKVTSAASSSELPSTNKVVISIKRTGERKSPVQTVKKMRKDK